MSTSDGGTGYEYNRTPLAVNDGWIHRPTEAGLLEIRALMKHLRKDGLFLDIGTGMGIVPRFVKGLGIHTISVDSEVAAGRSALENVRLAGVEALPCDVTKERLPVEDGTVDCVLFADVIEHLLHSPKPALMEIHRVLKPGGVCIATTPNALRLTVRLRVLAGYSNWANIDEYFDRDFHAGHHHEYTIEEFKGAFTRTGFEIAEFALYEDSLRNVKIEGLRHLKTQDRSRSAVISEPFTVKIGKRLLRTLTDAFPRLRSNMLLTARKRRE